MDWLKQIIVGHELHFSAPAEFDDPLDSRPKMTLSDPEPILKLARAVFRQNHFAKMPLGELITRLLEQVAADLRTKLAEGKARRSERPSALCGDGRPDPEQRGLVERDQPRARASRFLSSVRS